MSSHYTDITAADLRRLQGISSDMDKLKKYRAETSDPALKQVLYRLWYKLLVERHYLRFVELREDF